jgi:hypothetical protein
MAEKRGRPFLGETTKRSEAFPGLASLDVTVSQDPYGMFPVEPYRRLSKFTLANIPRRIECVNPKCQQGGVDLQMQVVAGDGVDRQVYCGGHEGTPAGRRKGDPCMNTFKITISSTRLVLRPRLRPSHEGDRLPLQRASEGLPIDQRQNVGGDVGEQHVGEFVVALAVSPRHVDQGLCVIRPRGHEPNPCGTGSN